MLSISELRNFLKNRYWSSWDQLERDQEQGVSPPPLEKPVPGSPPRVDLIAPEAFTLGDRPLREVIQQRRSRRRFTKEPLTLEELSFLLWSTQGVKRVGQERVHTLRTVPSAGARHPFETYLILKNVEGLQPGLYRYLALEHQVIFLEELDHLREKTDVSYWLDSEEAALFIWSAIPYRTEWRYGILSHKMIALDAGHVCQNLYLASEAIGAGTCAIGAYWQDEMDALLSLDGEDEFAIYMARVGKIAG
jgi:SagB-type dehydrogenase family enzyme